MFNTDSLTYLLASIHIVSLVSRLSLLLSFYISFLSPLLSFSTLLHLALNLLTILTILNLLVDSTLFCQFQSSFNVRQLSINNGKQNPGSFLNVSGVILVYLTIRTQNVQIICVLTCELTSVREIGLTCLSFRCQGLWSVQLQFDQHLSRQWPGSRVKFPFRSGPV
jgi:hypothetical protein